VTTVAKRRDKSKYRALRAAGLCLKCRVVVVSRKCYCDPCRLKYNARRKVLWQEAHPDGTATRYRALRAAGLCTNCRSPTAGYACPTCKAKRKVRDAKRDHLRSTSAALGRTNRTTL